MSMATVGPARAPLGGLDRRSAVSLHTGEGVPIS